MVSGYAQDASSDKHGEASAGKVDARPEIKADGVLGKDADTSPSLEAKTRPKKGLFGGLFGSSKALAKVSTAAAVRSWLLLRRCDSFTSFAAALPLSRTS